MKPRNKREIEVARLSAALPEITSKQTAWAKDHVFAAEAYGTKNSEKLWCSECAHTWSVGLLSRSLMIADKEKIECPHCHAKLTIVESRKQKIESTGYMTIVTVVGNYQVLRHFYCHKCANSKQQFQHFFINEVVQEWITICGKYKSTIIAKPRTLNGAWGCGSDDFSIKDYRPSYYGYYGSNPYHIAGEIYDEIKILPELKKRGLSKKVLDIRTPSIIIEALMSGNNDAELCIKTKQYDMLAHISSHYNCLKYKASFNICNRNHYIIKDASMWEDYLQLLDYFKKDIRNAHFVCPKDLKAAHDYLMRKKGNIEAAQRKRQQYEAFLKRAAQLKADIREFYKSKMRFFDLCLQDENIIIRPLQSITEFYKEAKIMHHCVYSNEYYKKPDSLILSARDKNGKRLETVEVSLSSFEVVQSRSVCNGNSVYHNQIIDLVKCNMNLINQAKCRKHSTPRAIGTTFCGTLTRTA